ncbi:MAG: hypothetical protein BWY66_02482 [bacterium ADurb.Bin374]|nr:MAG: hypothetical protein BWY66_02482 [bacterium ADurb.Bin374]
MPAETKKRLRVPSVTSSPPGKNERAPVIEPNAWANTERPNSSGRTTPSPPKIRYSAAPSHAQEKALSGTVTSRAGRVSRVRVLSSSARIIVLSLGLPGARRSAARSSTFQNTGLVAAASPMASRMPQTISVLPPQANRENPKAARHIRPSRSVRRSASTMGAVRETGMPYRLRSSRDFTTSPSLPGLSTITNEAKKTHRLSRRAIRTPSRRRKYSHFANRSR